MITRVRGILDSISKYTGFGKRLLLNDRQECPSPTNLTLRMLQIPRRGDPVCV